MSDMVETNAIDLDMLARLLINENLVKTDDIDNYDVPGFARAAIGMLLNQDREQAAELEALRAVVDAARKVVALYMSQDMMSVTVAFDDALHGLNNVLKGLQE